MPVTSQPGVTLRSLSQFFPESPRYLNETLCRSTLGLGDHDRYSEVTALPNFSKDRDFTQERETLAFGFDSTATVAKDLNALARRCPKIAHVFDDAQNWDIDLFEHGDAFPNHA